MPVLWSVTSARRHGYLVGADGTAENAKRFIDALAPKFNFSADVERSILEMAGPLQIRLDGAYAIDVLTAIHGVSTLDAINEAELTYCTIGEVRILSKVHLIQSKRSRGEQKDLKDIGLLEASTDP